MVQEIVFMCKEMLFLVVKMHYYGWHFIIYGGKFFIFLADYELFGVGSKFYGEIFVFLFCGDFFLIDFWFYQKNY